MILLLDEVNLEGFTIHALSPCLGRLHVLWQWTNPQTTHRRFPSRFTVVSVKHQSSTLIALQVTYIHMCREDVWNRYNAVCWVTRCLKALRNAIKVGLWYCDCESAQESMMCSWRVRQINTPCTHSPCTYNIPCPCWSCLVLVGLPMHSPPSSAYTSLQEHIYLRVISAICLVKSAFTG